MHITEIKIHTKTCASCVFRPLNCHIQGDLWTKQYKLPVQLHIHVTVHRNRFLFK